MLAVGYSDEARLITFANSWGRQWGQNGFGYLPYDYFSAYLSDAWMSLPREPGPCRPDARRVAELASKYKAKGKYYVSRLSVFPNPALGHACAIIDLWDMAEDLRIGWCFMTLRDGEDFIEIEDFFLRREFYGTGHQHRLAHAVLEFAEEQGFPIRLWVAFADIHSPAANFRNLNDFLRTADMNLRLRPSPYPWAAYVGEQAG